MFLSIKRSDINVKHKPCTSGTPRKKKVVGKTKLCRPLNIVHNENNGGGCSLPNIIVRGGSGGRSAPPLIGTNYNLKNLAISGHGRLCQLIRLYYDLPPPPTHTKVLDSPLIAKLCETLFCPRHGFYKLGRDNNSKTPRFPGYYRLRIFGRSARKSIFYFIRILCVFF